MTEEEKENAGGAIATKEEILAFLTRVLREGALREQMKAAELLGKRSGAFTPEDGEDGAALIDSIFKQLEED